MSTAILVIQRPNETTVVAAGGAAMKKAWYGLFSKQHDERETFLAESQSHDDYAIRLRALAEHEARLCALSQVF